MPKCWIIEDGEYSDYRVIGIFTTKENAERVRQYYGDGEVTERELDPNITGLNEGLTQYGVRFTKDKTEVLFSHAVDQEDFYWDNGSYHYVWAADQTHAIKIAAERRAQHLAEQAGIA